MHKSDQKYLALQEPSTQDLRCAHENFGINWLKSILGDFAIVLLQGQPEHLHIQSELMFCTGGIFGSPKG
jgi:hypothetical protein